MWDNVVPHWMVAGIAATRPRSALRRGALVSAGEGEAGPVYRSLR